jgi:hypothetical protein
VEEIVDCVSSKMAKAAESVRQKPSGADHQNQKSKIFSTCLPCDRKRLISIAVDIACVRIYDDYCVLEGVRVVSSVPPDSS